jgi:pimeloyl-ACP methyl ester carboxylesterase
VRRAYKIAIGVLVVLIALLLVNWVVTDNETKSAGVTVKGGRILHLPGGDLQVRESGPRDGSPIVLLHCYTCAIDWWDRLTPLLTAAGHHVIAIDLLGHGGSEKPSSGYSMEDQAQLVAQALGVLGVTDATVVGHSLGGTVAVALAEKSPDLVNRIVDIDQAPDKDYGPGLGFVANLGYFPVIGQATWRLKPRFAVSDGLSRAFAPGYDVPGQFVDDVYRMTYSSYKDTVDEEESFTDDEPLDKRLEPLGKPLLVIFGSEDQIYNPRESLSAYADIPDTKTDLITGAGHSPNVEKPTKVAALMIPFTRDAPSPADLQRAAARKRRAERRRQRAVNNAQTEARKKARQAKQSAKKGSGKGG